jgi:C1A family cysteine protease
MSSRFAAVPNMLALALSLLFPAGSFTQPMPVRSPVNPAFIDHLDAVARGTWRTVTTDGHGLGHIPPPVQVSYLLPPSSRPRPQQGLPTSYDLRTVPGKLPPVRNQGGCGSCWAFATYGSLESCNYPGDTLDCSENNLKNLHGFDKACCAGGNGHMSAAYLARGAGPVSEADDPYDPGSCVSPTGLTTQRHVREWRVLPSRASKTDNDAIKHAIQDYGPVYVGYYHENTYLNATYNSYYYPGTTNTNHAVALIGWDDDFPASRFNFTPPGNGAFIVRNSWGSTWGDGGHFYMSYYDNKVGEFSVFMPWGSVFPLTSYAYDPLGWTGDWGYIPNSWMANRFPRAATDEQLVRVGFYTNYPNVSYELTAYANPVSGHPTNGGTCILTPPVTGTFTYAGSHTVTLPSPVALTSAYTAFSLVLKLTTASTGYSSCCIEHQIAGYTSAATAAAGEGFYSANGSTWRDLTWDLPNASYCLKAFVYPGPLTVRLDSFQARPVGDGVRLTWETASEIGTIGFNILRADRPDGPFVCINDRMIAATGVAGRPTAYEFADRDVQAGRTYYYRLAEVDERGGTTEHPVPPVRVPERWKAPFGPAPASVRDLLWLPMSLP